MRFLALSLFSFLFLCSSFAVAQTEIENLITKADETYDSNPAESFSYFEKAEKLANDNNQHEFDGEISVGKGRYFLLVTRYESSLNELNNAISIFKNSKNQERLIAAYSLKSILHGRLGESKKSHILNLEVLKISKQINDYYSINVTLNNLSLYYLGNNDLDSALIVLNELDSYKANFDESEFYYYNQNWGSYYRHKSEYDLALNKFFIAKKIADSLNMIDSRATILCNIALTYNLKGSLKIANQYALESYKFSVENNLIYEQKDALEALILISANQKNYKEAFDYQSEWTKIDKEIFSVEKLQKIKAIEGQLEISEKEKIITEGEVALQSEKLKGAETKNKMFWLFGVVIIVLLLMAFTVFIYVKTKKLNTTINQQKKEVEIKSNSLEYALKNINDSIEYSKRIQNAILPPIKLVKSYLKDSFILYKPKDIVAGDFYWMENKNGKILFAAADCTGHGVPGAMVSVICNNALNRSVREHGLTDPGKILDKSREIVVQEFEKSDEEVKDGMDIALCCLDGKTLTFAGAHNPLWIIRDGELIEIKGDKQPIGQFFNNKPFQTHTIELVENDSLYIFSDGYADQFGGEDGKKFKVKNFKALLLNIQDLSIDKQKDHINEEFEKWKGDLEQLDDVCIIGVKI